MAWEYPHDFVSDSGSEWCAVCGASCLGHGTKEGDEAALASISAAKRMTDASAQERARAIVEDNLWLHEGHPTREATRDLTNQIAAALTEATRQGAEEMRERAAQLSETHHYGGAPSLVQAIRALSLDGGDRE